MAAPLVQDEDDILKDDFYSLLNVSREATKEEINQAYKQLCKIYHPDKHQDPLKKKNAELLFSKLKKAHEILTDEHKRVVYNLYGEKGLESYGMEVISRTKTPAEIIAEYERFQQEQEERRLQQRTNPKSAVVIGVNATDLFESYDYDDDLDDDSDDIPSSSIPNIEISGMNIHQSVDCPLTSQNTAIFAADVGSQNGRGTGVFMATWKRLMSNRGSLEVEASCGSKAGITCRFSKQIFKRCVGNMSVKLTTTKKGIAPNIGSGLIFTFDKHWQGRLRYNILAPSSLSSVLVYNSDTQQMLFQVMLSIRNSYIFVSYTKKFEEKEGSAHISVKAGSFGAVVEYGVEKKISSFSTVGATMSVGMLTGVNLRLKLERGQHTMIMPISLSEEIVPSAVFYGTITPIIVYFAVKKLVVDPFLSGQKERELDKHKQEQQEKIQQRKKEAQALVELMKETVERSTEIEERKSGLIVMAALYGKLTAGHETDMVSDECIDVTIPLQALVKDSKLISPDKSSKSSLPGFYDPCLGGEKQLYIKYKFRKKLHHVTLEDIDSIRLPQQKHLVRDEEIPPFIVPEDVETL